MYLVRLISMLFLTNYASAANSPFYIRTVTSNQDLGGINQNFTDIASCFQNSLTSQITPTSCPSGYALTGAFYNSCGTAFGGTCSQIAGPSGLGFWAANGSNIYNTNLGNVGINNSSPGNKLDVTGVIRADATSFVNPISGTGLEMAYDTVANQGYLNPFDRTNTLYKQMLISGNPLIFSNNGTQTYTINSTSTTFSAGYGVLAPVLPEPGVIVMYATSLNTMGGTDPWTVIYSTGGFVNTAGSTTRGLQEAINASAPNGIPLIIRGGGSTSSGGTQPYILATSQVTVPATQGWRWDAYNVNLSFSSSVSTDCLKFDSFEITDINFQGQIVCQGLGAAIRFTPTNVTPIDHLLAETSSHLYFSNVVQTPPASSTATAVIQFDPVGGINQNSFSFGEINGAGAISHSAATKYCVVVTTPNVTTAFEQNHVFVNESHACLLSSLQEGVSTTNQANLRHNHWESNGLHTAGPNAGYPNTGMTTYGSNEVWDLGGITNEEGFVSTGIWVNNGSNVTLILAGTVGIGSNILLDNGTNTSLITGTGWRIPNLTLTTTPAMVFNNQPGVMRPSADSTSAIEITNAASSGSPVLDADTTNSRVGINTASPAQTLDINGSAVFGSGTTRSTFTTTGNLQLVSGSTITSNGTLSISTAASAATTSIPSIFVNNTSVVVSGNASPYPNLWSGITPPSFVAVSSDSNTSYWASYTEAPIFLQNPSGTNNNWNQLGFADGINNGGGINIIGSLGMQETSHSTPSADMVFGTASPSISEHMRLTSPGHIEMKGSAPAVASCGAGPAGSVVGNDNIGIITVGGGVVTACTLNFNTNWTNTPACNITDSSASVGAAITSASNSGITIGLSATLGGGTIYYNCRGYR